MSLNDWLKAQWLKAHKTSRQEIANLLGVADRDLRDCQKEVERWLRTHHPELL
jgi:phage portal protein BeeE